MARSITIEDVARAAGVSRQTVSRVINRSPRVSSGARTRVEQAIAALGWVPSLAARSMAGGRSRLLLAVFAEPEAGTRSVLPLGDLLLAGLAACNTAGYRLLFEQLPVACDDDTAAAAQLATTIAAAAPDGVILLPALAPRAALRAAVERSGTALESLHPAGQFPQNPGEAAARHLLALGHRAIGFIAGAADPVMSQRNLDGYRRALAQKGSSAHRHFVSETAPDLGAALTLARSWLTPTIRPTAIIAERAETALAVLHVAAALRLAVPRDLSLIALEDDPALAASEPPLATLHTPTAALFAAACARLIARAEDPAAPPAPPPLSIALIERRSFARAPRAL